MGVRLLPCHPPHSKQAGGFSKSLLRNRSPACKPQQHGIRLDHHVYALPAPPVLRHLWCEDPCPPVMTVAVAGIAVFFSSLSPLAHRVATALSGSLCRFAAAQLAKRRSGSETREAHNSRSGISSQIPDLYIGHMPVWPPGEAAAPKLLARVTSAKQFQPSMW